MTSVGRLVAFSTALAALGLSAVLAASPPDRTGTGGGPDTTVTAPNTTRLGVTKPPGAEEGPATPQERKELQRIERQDKRIENGVCDGCR